MAYTLIAHGAAQTNGSGNAVVTLNCTGADLITILSIANDGLTAPQDDQSNTYILARAGTFWSNSGLFYNQAPTTNASQVFTLSNANRNCGMAVAAWSGSTSTPLDATDSAANFLSPLQGTSGLSPAQDNELLVTTLSLDWFDPASVDSGFTIIDHLQFNSGVAYGVAIAYLIQTTATPVNPTWTFSGGSSSLVSACFKAAAGGATSWGPLLSDQLNRLVQGN